VPTVTLARYENDGTATMVAASGGDGDDPFKIGTRWSLEDPSVLALVRQTGRPARIDDYSELPGVVAAETRRAGICSAVGSPIVVGGRLWGVILLSAGADPLPEGIEARVADFTELLATAVANAETRAELAASRARIVAAGDESRRRIERDLHDGVQQQLVTLALALRSIEAAAPLEREELREQVSQVAEGLATVLDELREMSQGIHPAILSAGGLGPALRTLARRSAVPVGLDIRGGERRLPAHVEVAGYYVVSEALANAAKHARASAVHIELVADDGAVRLSIRDDGVGGADPERGSGLIGLRDRVEALGGTIEIASPAGGGTSLLVTLPFDRVAAP
jgi:signal transduction histidine kinase